MLTVAGGSSIESVLFTKLSCEILTLSITSTELLSISDYSIFRQVRALTGLIQPKRSSPCKIQIVKNDICVPNFKTKLDICAPNFKRKYNKL